MRLEGDTVILIPELKTVLILVPRTASGSFKRAVLTKYPRAMMPYRHMEADGIPVGYDRWQKVGVCRHPVERLWSLFKFIGTMGGEYDEGSGHNDPNYIAALRGSLIKYPSFSDWVLNNETVFSQPHDASSGKFYPNYYLLHALPENTKSQFVYLRPDLGTLIYDFDNIDGLASRLRIELPHTHKTESKKPPPLSRAAKNHVRRVFEWEINRFGYRV